MTAGHTPGTSRRPEETRRGIGRGFSEKVEQGFAIEPWRIRETGLQLDRLAQTESIFSLSNGHIGVRGNLDEGEPHGLPGTYLNSFYELRPLPYAEPGYGYPESGQTVVNVTNGKLMRLLVDDEPFDVRYGQLRSHERVLDMRAGVLRRSVEWVSPAGDAVRVRSTRLVSFDQRGIVAIEYEVEPVSDRVRIIVQSELVANEAMPAASADPRVAAALDAPLVAEEQVLRDSGALLVHQTRQSKLRMAAAMDHLVFGPEKLNVATEVHPDWGRTTVASILDPGETLRIIKFVSYGFSSRRSQPAVRDQVDAALAAARLTGWDHLVIKQREFLDDYWASGDVVIEGDAEVQQAIRFAMFHILQNGARLEDRPIAAKGLSGPGYDGHVFWDTESFVLPVLTYTAPRAAADVLRWRHATLDFARERVKSLGLGRGAAFPWRTIRGQECSAYWPAGTAAMHISADIAAAVERYVSATGDAEFEEQFGLELLVETARLWRSLGHHDRHGRFHLDGMTGPDEYSAVADDNTYTNLVAQANLVSAVDAIERHPARAAELGVDDEETAAWREAAEAMHVPYDAELGVHQQAEGFTRYQEWDFANQAQYPLLLHYPYFDLYRRQVVKQADLVLAMHWRGDAFTAEQKARNFDYYERRTVRDSSLSACTQAVIAAEVGHLELAHDYLGEAALMDLHDLEHNTGDGLHIASLAGVWQAVVMGLGGMRTYRRVLSFAPRLPSRIGRLSFSVLWRGRCVSVDIRPDLATYSLVGSTLDIEHHGTRLTVSEGKPVTSEIPANRPMLAPPPQPPGRAPVPRSLQR